MVSLDGAGFTLTIQSRIIEIKNPKPGMPYSMSDDVRAFYAIETP